MNKIKNQEKIKNKLCSFDVEENHRQILDFRKHFALSKDLPKITHDFKDLSDWSNKNIDDFKQLKGDIAEIANTTQRSNQFSSNLVSTRYQSSLLSSENGKKIKIELSPVIVKFNARILSLNLQHSKKMFVRRIKQDLSLTHYKSLNMLYERKTSKKQPKSNHSYIQSNQKIPQVPINEKIPMTERMSNIFRSIKKREPVKIYRRKIKNPEDLSAFKIF